MRPSTLFFALFRFLLPPALIFTAYLYLYPAAHGCSFPDAKPSEAACLVPGQQKAYKPSEVAPFRLLALGDPQLEGDTSLPDPDAPLFPSLRGSGERLREGNWDGLREKVGELMRRDLARVLQGYRKRLDLWGNDLYLAHIYRSLSWWTQPTHTVVLGDLLGSQWIGDEEFWRRSDRFWKRVFKGGEKLSQTVTNVNGRKEILGQDDSWKRRIIAVAGNHDIGYAGDIHEQRIERFEDAFGRVNWDIRFRLERNASQAKPVSVLEMSPLESHDPELHLIILNSMNLDEPASRPELQKRSRDFIDEQLQASRANSLSTGTVLLTHIPFHKEAGVCVDSPYFSYFPSDQGGGIKEQNHLSKRATDHILNGLMKSGEGVAIVLNGHDHEGCDTYHYRRAHTDPSGEGDQDHRWHAKHQAFSTSERTNSSLIGLREITVRSMMGSFHGNAGLLSAWFDHDAQEWKFEYDVCVLGVQHIWWAVHVLDIVVVGLGVASLLSELVEAFLIGNVEGKGKGDSRGKVKKA